MACIDHTTADGVVVQHGDTVWDEHGNALNIRGPGPDGKMWWTGWVATTGHPLSTVLIRQTYSTEKAALLDRYERLERQIDVIESLQVAVSRRLVELDEQES